MKNVFIGSILCLAALSLLTGLPTGCGQAAEEPTAQAQPQDLIPMVMVNGSLYLDTGKESDITARCGVMDGEITASCGENEKPDEDNESNFGKGYGYQFVSNDAIDVFLNEAWMRFEKEKNNAFGISLSTKDVTSQGLTLLCTQSGGQASGELQTGSPFFLEQRTEKGWQALPSPAEIAWTEEAWLIPRETAVEWSVDWAWLYGSLPPGAYRIGKEITSFREPKASDKLILYAEFEIPA